MSFADIEAVVLEPNASTRGGICNALNTVGINRISVVYSPDELERTLTQTTPDLVVAESSEWGLAATKLMRSMRHGSLGRNPFTVVMATTLEPTAEAVKTIIDSGIDTLIAKPFRGADVIDRLTTMIHDRKPFVVTRDYIGPDRRSSPRKDQDWPLLDVPNTFKDKADGTHDPRVARALIEDAKRAVDEQKASYDILLITRVVADITAAYQPDAVDEDMAGAIKLLCNVARDIKQRIEAKDRFGEPSEVDLAALCGSLLTVATKMSADKIPQLDDIRLLKNLVDTIHMSFESEHQVAKFAKSITAEIDGASRFKAA